MRHFDPASHLLFWQKLAILHKHFEGTTQSSPSHPFQGLIMKPAIQSLALLLFLSWQSCSTGQENEPVLMEVHNIQPIPGKSTVAVILLEKEGDGYLPIFVDEGQALSIYLGQKGEKATRLQDTTAASRSAARPRGRIPSPPPPCSRQTGPGAATGAGS
jgi:hypothetical protein